LKMLGLLRRPGLSAWVLYKLDGGLDHVLVDEAQDTSPEQWEILRLLTEDFFSGETRSKAQRTLFVVGDEKQSIFSFQGAEPRQFSDMQSWFRRKIEGAKQQFVPVPLYRSFRSVAPVLETLDRVFATEAAKRGLVFLEQDVQHEVDRADAPGVVEL